MTRHSARDGQGWIRKEFREVKRMIRESNAGKRLESATIGRGGLRVKGGGRITAEYPSGAASSYYGPIIRDADGKLVHGIAALDPSGSTIFTAYSSGASGDRGVVDGDAKSVWFHALDSAGIEWLNPGGFPNLVRVDPSGVLLQAVTGTHKMPGMGSTSSGANMWIDVSNGDVKRSTSSRRYKQDIEDHHVEVDAVLQMRPASWRDRGEVETDPGTNRRYVGFIAEELHDLGLTEFVVYDTDGEPEAIAYDRLAVALVELAKSQQALLDDLAARVSALEEV